MRCVAPVAIGVVPAPQACLSASDAACNDCEFERVLPDNRECAL